MVVAHALGAAASHRRELHGLVERRKWGGTSQQNGQGQPSQKVIKKVLEFGTPNLGKLRLDNSFWAKKNLQVMPKRGKWTRRPRSCEGHQQKEVRKPKVPKVCSGGVPKVLFAFYFSFVFFGIANFDMHFLCLEMSLQAFIIQYYFFSKL